MSFRVNAAAWNGVFAIPNCIVDEHIKKAGGQAIKVLLFLLRHQGEDLDARAIAKGTGMDVGDVKDAFLYWKEVGIVYEDGETPPNVKQAEDKVNLKALPDVAPTYDQVAARTLEDANLRALFNEVQLKLGRTIGYGDQAQLLMMLDYYGLPVEVILTIVEYCMSKGKVNISYISKVAKDWGEREINTLERADEYLKALKSDERLWKKFSDMFSVDPPQYNDSRFQYLKHWRNENKQSFELIYYAYEITVDRINKVNFKYMNSILDSWKADGINTPVDAQKATGKAPVKSGDSFKKSEPSYDSDKYKEKAHGPIEYKRRKKEE